MNTKQIKIRGNIDLNNNSQIGQKHDWLHPIDQNHLNSRADDYFRDVSYYLNLQDIYKVIDTCYYNEQMEYVPVLVQIMQEKVKQSFGDAEYLLQVWHSQTKKQIFQIPLKGNISKLIFLAKIKSWNITYDYLLFVEEGSVDAIKIVSLLREDVSSVIQILGIPDLINIKYYQIFEDYLVCAYHDMKLVFITVQDSSLFRAKEDIRVDQLPQLTYQCKLPIQALLLLKMQKKGGVDEKGVKKLIIAFETIQNLLDFNFIIIKEVENDKLNISFNQARDVFPRPLVSPDPVVQCIIRVMLTKFNNKQKYVVQGVTRRKSGQVDLYSNMMFKQQVPDLLFEQVGMSDHTFYFQTKQEKYFSLKLLEQQVLSFEQAEEIPDSMKFKMSNLPIKIVERYAKLFQSFHMIMVGQQTICFIAHQNFVSAFDLIAWKWVNHIKFSSKIIQLFFQKTPIREYSQNESENDESAYKSCVLLEDKSIYMDISRFIERQDLITEAEKDFEIPFMYHKSIEVSDTTDFSDAYFLLHNGEGLVIILHEMSMEKHEFSKSDSQKKLEIVQLQMPTYEKNEGYKIVVSANQAFSVHLLLKRDKIYITKEFDINVSNQQSKPFSDFHSAFTLDIENHIVLFNKQHALILDLKNRQVNQVYDINCQGFILFNLIINYAVCYESPISPSQGLKMIDAIALSESNEIKMLLLKEEDIGAYSNIYFDSDISRICFMQSVHHIIITPYMHTNINKFMGMGNPAEYLFHKVRDHKMMALRKNGEVVTWNICNGKYLSSFLLKQKQYDYNEYDYYTHSNDRLILISKTEIKNCNDEWFFNKTQLATSFDEQIPVIKATTHKFHRFLLIDIEDSMTVKVILDFVFPKFTKQKIFINSSNDRLIIKLEFQRIFIYKKVQNQSISIIKNFVSNLQGNTSWELIRQITDYPYFFDNPKSIGRLEPFTHDFKLYIRYSKKQKGFLLKYSDTGELHSAIPSDILTLMPFESSIEFMNRFKWLDTERFMFTNVEGYEKIVSIKTYQVLAQNYRPLFNDISGEEWKIWPYYNLREDLKTDILSRLKRMYQMYKTLYYLHDIRDETEFYQHLLSVDKQNFEYYEHSFTFLHWSLMDQLVKKKIKLKTIQPGMIEFMIYNILPGGNTILHKLHESQDKIAKLFRLCHHENQIKYHIPFLQNFHQQSPIDLSLGLDQKDFKSIFSVLQYLGLYPIDHHSKAIKGSLYIMVEQELPEFLDYLDTRFQQTQAMEKFDKGQIKNEIITTSLCMQEQQVQQKMLKDVKSEAKIRIELLDIPGAYHYLDPDFIEIFKALSSTESYLIFENKAIKCLIDFNFPVVRNFLLLLLIIPFTVFHITFVVYMNVVYEKRTESLVYETVNYILAIYQVIMCAYFLFNEMRQVYNLGLQYLYSVWNYIDILAPAGVAILHGIQFAEFKQIEINQDFNRCVLAISTFLMWLKFLSTLRIFKSTGYLIRMIVQVIYDMGIFLFVLLITVAAFGDSFLRIAWGNEEENQFTTSFVPAVLFAYSMILGGYDTEAFGDVAVPLVWIFWVLCTILDMIVMLNLLIAIISSTFERVNENQEQASYQEMASLISENHYLIPKRTRQKYAEQNVYLLVGYDLEKLKDFKDPLDQKFQEIKNEVSQIKTTLREEIKLQEQRNQKALESQNASELELKMKMGEIKLLIFSQQPEEKVRIRMYKKLLTKTTLYQFRERIRYDSYKWVCFSRYYSGCLSGYTANEFRSVENEQIYHCADCNFDLCVKCNGRYEVHQHELKLVTFGELRKSEKEYSAWGCDARYFISCNIGKVHDDPFEYLYIDYDTYYIFCQSCVKAHKI